MKEITGAFSSAKIFTDVVEENAIEQIQTLCNQPFTEGCRIRVMPDAHSGKGGVIGFTSRAESSAKAQEDCSADILNRLLMIFVCERSMYTLIDMLSDSGKIEYPGNAAFTNT